MSEQQMTPEELFDAVEKARALQYRLEEELHPLEESMRERLAKREPLDRDEFLKVFELRALHRQAVAGLSKLL